MSRVTGRRSRTLGSDDEDTSRASTPISTAPNDSKRLRRTPVPDEDESASPSPIPLRSTKSKIKKQDASRSRPQHQPGAIVRVKLTNFVTYTSAEFFPGPNLNMVIGPNGTGKSTLVCAICLGLGWGPQLLGRAKDLSEFVKHGCKEAIIEIELQRAISGANTTSCNNVITRVIKKDNNKSSFMINGKTAANKVVLDLVRRFNIQVDNLCQFLPQDRVVEFAQMNPVQMLESTLHAAADPTIPEYHEKLKQLREEQRELMFNNKGDRETLNNLEKRQEGQRFEVERLKERQIAQKRIEWLEKCRPIPQYSTAKQKHTSAKERRNLLDAELKQLKRESGPALRKVNEKQTYCNAAKENLSSFNERVKRESRECERLDREIKSLAEQTTDCGSQIDSEKRSLQPTREKMNRLRQQVTVFKNQKKTPPEPIDTEAINEDMTQRRSRIRELMDKGDNGQARFDELVAEGQEKATKRNELKSRLANLATQSGQQENKLDTLSTETFQAWKWIQENRDKFTKNVFGPPIVECSVKNPELASALEALLQANDFKILTVQCHEDFKLLQQQLTKVKGFHDVSIRTCPYENLDHLKAPVSDADRQNYGLEQWAIDCLDGPAPVLAMLCQERFLHASGIAAQDVSSEQHDAISRSAIRSYVAGNRSNRFTRRAEYGAAGSVATVREVRPARFWSNQPVEMGRKAGIEREIAELKGEFNILVRETKQLKEEIDGIKNDRKAEEAALEKVRKEKESKQQALMDYRGLDTKIENLETQVEQSQAEIAAVNVRCAELGSKRDETMLLHAAKIVEYCQAIHALKELNGNLLEAQILAIEAENDFENLGAQNQHLLDSIKEKEKERENAKLEVNSTMEAAKKLMEQVKHINAEGEKLQEEASDSGLLDLLQDLINKPNFTESDLNDDIEVEQARLQLTEGGNANIIKEFEERGRKIEKLRSKLTDFNKRQSDYMTAIKEVRAFFERGLSPIVAKINDAFSDSFARIGCAGQVALFKASSEDPADCTEEMGGAENGLDFANWAVHISVKFRETEPLSLLDSHRQSGGERAVSTIFYLMALQSLSRSPFRVVDEINQGMDPRNERMVHGRMVDIAAADEDGNGQGSQYFLITPKLLSGLKYRQGMTVLCIVSGENMPSATDDTTDSRHGGSKASAGSSGRKLDFSELARKARALGLGDVAGQRIDSGVGMGSSFGSSNQLRVGA